MANNAGPWCIAPSHPLIKKVVEAYKDLGITKETARVIINTARKWDAALRTDKVSLKFLQGNKSFQKILKKYQEKTNDLSELGALTREKKEERLENFRKEIEQSLSERYSADEVADMLERKDRIESDARLSKISSKDLAAIIEAFPDTRRLEYIGNLICRYTSELITTIDTDNEFRESIGVEKRRNRIDYFMDTELMSALANKIKAELEEHAVKLEEAGNTQLANELRAAQKYFFTIRFIYGGSLFRNEGIKIGIPGNIVTTEDEPADSTRTDTDEGDDPDTGDQEELQTNSFSLADQNKSVSSKMLSPVRLMLSELKVVNSEGKPVADRYGYGLWEYLPVSTAQNTLLNICKGKKTFSQMYDAIKKAEKGTPWIGQVVRALDTESTKDATGNTISTSDKERFQTQFFISLRKQFTDFRTTVFRFDDNGAIYFVNMNLNTERKSQKILNDIRHKFRIMSGLPIIRGGGIDFTVFNPINDVITKGSDSINSIILSARDLVGTGNYDAAYSTLKRAETKLISVLNNFGLEVTSETLATYLANGEAVGIKPETYNDATRYEFERYAGKLGMMVEYARHLNKAFNDWGNFIRLEERKGNKNLKDNPTTNPLPDFGEKNSDYNNLYYIRNWYNRILDSLNEFSPDMFEPMAYVNGKSYYSWNNPSSLGNIVESLSDTDRKSLESFIMDKYGQDKVWFLKQNSTDGNPHFYSDWLEDIWYNGDKISYSEKPVILDKDYDQLTDLIYNISMLQDFYAVQDDDNSRADYRILITSDKPRYITINAKKYTKRSKDFATGMLAEDDFRTYVTRKAQDFFAQEIIRSRDVVAHALSNDDLEFDDYDIDLSDYPELAEKIESRSVKVEDVLNKNGEYIFKGTGASFFENPFIISEIERKTKLGKYVVDKVFNTIYTEPGKNATSTDALDRTIINTFNESFRDYMTGLKVKYIEHLEKLGALDSETVPVDGQYVTRLKYFSKSMRDWHSKDKTYSDRFNSKVDAAFQIAKEELKGKEEEENIRRIFNENRNYFLERAQLSEDLDEFIYNNYLAKVNVSQIFNVDFAFYGNSTNFQKRNAQTISAGTPVDTEARIHGKRVLDAENKYRSATIKTDKEEISKHIDNIEIALRKVRDSIVDKNRRNQFTESMNYTLKKLREIDSTDGQAFTALTALRKRLAGQGGWTRSSNPNLDKKGYVEDENGKPQYYIRTDEAIYQRFLRNYSGENDAEAKYGDFRHVFAETQKPFVYTTPSIQRGDRTITVPIQHKNSEYALIFLTAMTEKEVKDQVTAIFRFMEDTARNTDGVRGIDTMNFDSGVKIGGNNRTVDITGLSGQETLDKLTFALLKNGKYEYTPGAVTEYDASDYKIQQSNPEHFKTNKQPLGSQLKILAISNIHDDEKIRLKNNKVITGKELKKRYFEALRKKTEYTVREFEDELGLNLPEEKRIHTLSNALKKWMSGDQKFSGEMRRALSVVKKDGVEKFVLPLDESGVQSSVEAMLYSKIRSVFYKQKTNGGIAIQATSWGQSDELHIRFQSSDLNDIKNRGGVCATRDEFIAEHPNLKSSEVDKYYKDYITQHQGDYAYFEMECPMPDYIRQILVGKWGTMPRKYFNADGSWNMEEIKKKLPAGAFDAICYRIPTEAKYSIMACKIVRFTREGSGSTAKYPREITVFTGSDFDIDKDFIELRPIPGSPTEEIDSEIFDLQMAALRSTTGLAETFHAGDFSDLSELSYESVLIDHGYSDERIAELKEEGKLKKECMKVESLDLLNPVTDVVLKKQNSDSKDMIAIAAVGNASHAFLALYNDTAEKEGRNPNTNPENFIRIKMSSENGGGFIVVNDKNAENLTQKTIGNTVILDPTYDMDGRVVATEISKYIGASADAAKDAAEYRLNITKDTLPLLITMHRIGISSDVARMFISQPIIKEVVQELNKRRGIYNSSLNVAIKAVRDELLSGETPENIKKRWDNLQDFSTVVLKYSDLRNNKRLDPYKNADYNLQLLSVMYTLSNKSKAIKNLDGYTRYNSTAAMKGASHLSRISKRFGIEKLYNNLNSIKPVISLPSDIESYPGSPYGGAGKLYSMFPHIGMTIETEESLAHQIIEQYMNTYSNEFYNAVRSLGYNEQDSPSIANENMKALYNGWKNYLLFVGDNRIVDFTNKNTVLKYTKNFAEHYIDTMNELEKNTELYDSVIKNNTFLNSIGFTQSKQGYDSFELLSTDVTGMSEPDIERYKADWEILLDHPETRQLAIDMSIHFLARSAAFDRNTPVNLMPLRVKEAIPNYIKAYEEANATSMTPDELESFLVMFARNNSDNSNIVPNFVNNDKSKKMYDYKNGVLIMKSTEAVEKLFNKDDEEQTISVYPPVIKVDGTLFLLDRGPYSFDEGMDKEGNHYIDAEPTTPLGIPYQMMEYTGLDNRTSIFNQSGAQATEGSMTQEDPEITPEIEAKFVRIGENIETISDAVLDTVIPGSEEMDSILRSFSYTGNNITDVIEHLAQNIVVNADEKELVDLLIKYGFTEEGAKNAIFATRKVLNELNIC